MKIISLCALNAQAYEISSRQMRMPRELTQEDRSFDEFKQAFNHHNNLVFDVPDAFSSFQNHLTSYGCHCLNINSSSRFMTNMGQGAALDGLDGLCKKYKECVQCAMKDHTFRDEQCDANDVRYTWSENSATGNCDGMAENNPNKRCKKAVCECDVMFATQFAAFKDDFNRDHSHTDTQYLHPNAAWNNAARCPQQGRTGSGNGSHKECCRIQPDPSQSIYFNVIYKTTTQQCTATAILDK